MTRRKGVAAEDDEGMRVLVGARTPVVTIVGKTWDLHVTRGPAREPEENLRMIADSVRFLVAEGREVVLRRRALLRRLRANPDYALRRCWPPSEAGADVLVPVRHQRRLAAARTSREIVDGAGARLPAPRGHPHPQRRRLAVANTLDGRATRGAVQVQGTINGFGERCGNVNLTTHHPQPASSRWTCDVARSRSSSSS